MNQTEIKKPPFPKSYADTFLLLESGKGVYVRDAGGLEYLDFGSGIAVNALGYGRKDLARTAARQMRKLVHVSNLYATQPSVDLAKRLVLLGDFAAVHFGNSGSEANETAIKFARLHALRTKGEGRHKLLCFNNAFHGRTLGALSCTPNAKYQEPFRPLLGDVTAVDFNDAAAVEKTLDDRYAGVIVEVVQGEGGLQSMTPEFAETLNELCRRHGALLIADEVQTGLGRCGRPLASEVVGLKPDIVTLSKPLAGGLPLSATLIPAAVNDLLHVGEHGTTFGGGPVTTAVAGQVLDIVLNPTFLESIVAKSQYLEKRLAELVDRHELVTAVRGMGMLRGLVTADGKEGAIPDLMGAAKEKGLLILRSGTNVLRIAPPLVISEKDIDRGVELLADVLREAE